jgi:hypothetical protein
MTDDNNGAEITAVASSAPAGDGGAESHAAGEGEGVPSSEGPSAPNDELPPVIATAATATPKGKRGAKVKVKKRTLTRAQKDERNRKLKLARDAAKAARIAKQGAKVASAPPGLKADTPAASSSSSSSAPLERTPAPADARVIAEGAPLEGQAAVIDDEDLQGLLGLSAHMLVGLIPERWGGGTLTDKERELLGRVLAGPVRPYIASSEAGPWVVVAGAFVQVLGIRAIAYAARMKEAAAPTGHHRPAADAPAPAAPVAPVAPASSSSAPAKAGKPAPRATVARGAANAPQGTYDNDDV